MDFRDGILFVPEVLLAANSMKAGMAILRPLLVDSVEEVAVLTRRGLLGPEGSPDRIKGVASRRRGHRDQFGEFPEILGCGCEVEFVAGPTRSS